jgi:glycosyltransferase involved in cell wall biosynthesis
VLYERARECAARGRLDEALRIYGVLGPTVTPAALRALVSNDRAALAALAGDLPAALRGFCEALEADPRCEAARSNLALVEADLAPTAAGSGEGAGNDPTADAEAGRPVKVAIVSFLFNWPSTGGGIVHTVELTRFLAGAGYDVRHFHARFAPWGVGRVGAPLPFASEALEFDEAGWDVASIQARFRAAVDAFGPDYVLLTDSWNMKPLLAEALRGHRVVLRLQAMECLCPLNNVRLLPAPGGGARQCPLDQLARPAECARCLAEHGATSGGLHQAERALSGAGKPGYHERLLRAFREAEAVLVVNPLTEGLVRPHARRVRVVTAGMDPARFPWPWPEEPAPREKKGTTLFFAGLVEEWMKGFHVLREACALLWRRRQDFELVATGEPPGRVDGFTRFVGWLSQEELPRHLRAADVVVLPTLAQEGLGRTAVEAMGVGRPVVASRLGGLPATVEDGVTGLLFEPGDPADLAARLETLLDDPALRERLGLAGRRRFEERYDWNAVIANHYRPLLAGPGPRPGAAAPPPYAPHIPPRVDRGRLVVDVAEFLGLPAGRAEVLFQSYLGVHEARGYARRLGECKTLCLEEAFVLYALLARDRPPTVAVVGAEDGGPARRLLDVVSLLGLPGRVVCFDAADRVRHFGRDEAELVVGDLAGRFRTAVLGAFEPGLVYLDLHPYPLLSEAVAQTVADGRWSLAVHDCGRGLCNPHMSLARDDPAVTSLTGVWERHVLAEVFAAAGPFDPRLDRLETATHRLRVFDTPHGLALALPR